MAEPGDPTAPKTSDPAVDHDELIGFPSAAALQGQARRVTVPEPQRDQAWEAERPDGEPGVDIFPSSGAPRPLPPTREGPAGMRAAEPKAPRLAAAPISDDPVAAAPAPTPNWAIETPARPIPVSSRRPAPQAPPAVEGANSLYAVYALILFAVPTLGVSALIALLAVTGRAGPSHPVAASHFMFQRRTLWTGGVAALLGGILIAVGLGVFVLFIVAVWLILRGTSGILALKAGRSVRDPRGWFLA